MRQRAEAVAPEVAAANRGATPIGSISANSATKKLTAKAASPIPDPRSSTLRRARP